MNLGPSGYEPDELPGCSTPRQVGNRMRAVCTGKGLVGQALAISSPGAPRALAAALQPRAQRSAPGTSDRAATSTMVAPVGVSANQEVT